AVARRPVAVVALLAQLDDAVPAHGGVRLAREPEAVRVQRARRVLRARDEHARALAAPLPRDADVERRRADVVVGPRDARLQDVGARGERRAERRERVLQEGGVRDVDGIGRGEGVRPREVERRDAVRVAAREARIRPREARGQAERAAAVDRAVEVARGVAVDAGLGRLRKAVRLRAVRILERPLEEAGDTPRVPAGAVEERRRHRRTAGRVAAVARRAVRAAVVARLVALDPTVAAAFGEAARGAAVARRAVAVVALLAGLDEA